jgi:hypothetical protein
MGRLDGGCLCGSVEFTCDAEPIGVANCHCTDCQKQTGSAFSTFVIVPADSVAITGDTLSAFTTIGTDSGKEVVRKFCSACGSPVISEVALVPGALHQDGRAPRPNGRQARDRCLV